MMPIWIFAIFIVLFVAVIIWERVSYKKLQGDVESLEFFLDLYVQKYGQIEGMLIVEEGSNGNKK